MYKAILSGILVLCVTHLHSQTTFKDLCQTVSEIDKRIYLIETDSTGEEPFKYDTKFIRIKETKEGFAKGKKEKKMTLAHLFIIQIIKDSLIPILEVGREQYHSAKFKAALDCIHHTETMNWLEFVIEEMVDSNHTVYSDINRTPTVLKEVHEIVRKRIDVVMGKSFSMYKFTETSRKPVKGIYIEHGNDFLSVRFRYNDDRDMTGSFRFEFFTDWLKMRIAASHKDRFRNINGRSWYTYQSFFIGGEGYTPYLRDTFIFKADSSFDPKDRPYASIKYFGRAKYRLYRDGKTKIFSQLKLGTIGSSSPNTIQSIIHRDITIGSLKPNGWGAQIASGGRIAFSYEVSHSFLFLSENWLLAKSISKHLKFKSPKFINVSIYDELKIGHDMTSAGIGIQISNRNFRETGGINLPFLDEKVSGWRSFLRRNVVLNYRYLYRHVWHNSMLEGYGIFGKHLVDEHPNSPKDLWVLPGDQIIRDIHIHEATINIRLRYCGIVFRQMFMNREYDMPVNYELYYNGPGKPKISHNRSAKNHIGTLGLFFKINN